MQNTTSKQTANTEVSSRETITKQQAAALLRGQLLPYFGYAVTLKDGRILGHGPNRGEYTLITK